MSMRPRDLIARGLGYYWRTHLAVVAGVATAVAVLAGALLVGDSVRASLRDLVVQRLGATDVIVVSSTFFREQLAADVRAHAQFAGTFEDVTPLVAARGLVTGQQSGRRAGDVRVYGVDDRFWRFHGVTAVSGPADRDALVSPALAREIGTAVADAILVRVERPSDIPLESLHGRKDDVGRTIRAVIRGVVSPEAMGEFSLEPQQGDVRAVFLPLSRLQQELQTEGRVNTLLANAAERAPPVALETILRDVVRPADSGVSLEVDAATGSVIVGSSAGLLESRQVEDVQQALGDAGFAGASQKPVFTYLANTLRVGPREVPYSLVTAIDRPEFAGATPTGEGAPAPILLNEWAARDLAARVGDELRMDFYRWLDSGQLGNGSASFRVAAIVPVEPGTKQYVPTYPGISDSASLEDWDPPFPIDLRRVRPIDEAYWDQYRTTPKAFIPLAAGQALWRSRYGEVTAIAAVAPPGGVTGEGLREAVETSLGRHVNAVAGLTVRDVRADSLSASAGAIDFGQYFVYFSFFLVVSALLLASLFFRLGVEQRVREVGLLRAVGYDAATVRRLFAGEGLILAVVGSGLGVAGAIGYAWAVMAALRTWWVDAVGTTALQLHVTAASLAAGAIGGIVAALACIWWTLRGLRRISERSLLAGQVSLDETTAGRPRRALRAAAVLAVAGLGLTGAGASGVVAAAGAFFGAGAALLAATLCLFSAVLKRPRGAAVAGSGWQPLARLGIRNASYRPGRSVLSASVIASATFMLISVDAFRRDGVEATENQQSGLGGYQVMVETLLPVAYDLSAGGREALDAAGQLGAMRFEPFRLLPGDDTSCLNLYVPQNPRILAPRDEFLRAGRFAFASSLATTDAGRANPWLLLTEPQPDGAIPVIGDANSMQYVLHKAPGDDIVMTRGGREIRLRLVATLRDSIFQGELLMSRGHFLAQFPDQEGFRVFLVDTAPERADAAVGAIEDALSEFGADATLTADKLATFHRVENTYLSTFQTLGGLGLLLGTVGLATVLLRNALERRRELALLGAVGFRRGHFGVMVLAENVLLLVVGLVAGAAAASLAIAPAIAERGGRLPLTASGVVLLVGVFLTGLLSSAVATRAVTRAPLLASLRSE